MIRPHVVVWRARYHGSGYSACVDSEPALHAQGARDAQKM